MKYLRYSLTAFWLVAIAWLGFKTSQNPIVFRILLALFLLAFFTCLGLQVRTHLDTVLRYARKMWFGMILIGFAMAISPRSLADEELAFSISPSEVPRIDFSARFASEATDYKTTRIREMAAMWKGTILEDRTVPLLAQLLVENGALSEHVRGDHGYAIGIEQNHICNRGFAATGFHRKHYCGQNAEARLAADLKGTQWDGYLTDWRTQFRHYSEVVAGMTKDGHSVDSIIKSWNSRESGRRGKVAKQESFVRKALDL